MCGNKSVNIHCHIVGSGTENVSAYWHILGSGIDGMNENLL
jgi:hypothetical protein